MERTSRLPSAPSRLPSVSSVRAPSGPPSGLPRLFGRGPVAAVANNELGTQSYTHVQQQAEESDLTPEEQELASWIGKRVCISGIKKGILMYFGKTYFAEGLFCGISLDEPEGRHDGEFNGHRYFTCPDKHGVFAPVSKVEKIVSPRLPPISSPMLCNEDLNRTFVSGKSPCNISMNGTFSRDKTPPVYGNALNSTFGLGSTPTCNGGLNETYVPVKSMSIGSDLDRTFNLKESPTSTYPLQKSRHYHRANIQAPGGHPGLICEDSQLPCYDEDDSSLGLLTDSQMGDFSVDGLLLMPKTQSCDDINELPEHEVVQDITVQYLDEGALPCDAVPFQSTPLVGDGLKHATFTLEQSISDDRSFSLLVDQEFPSLAFDVTLNTVTEDNNKISSGDDTTHPLASTEMPEEEEVSPQLAAAALTTKRPNGQSPPAAIANEICLRKSRSKACPDLSSEPPALNSAECSGLVDITTATGESIKVSKEAVIGAFVNSLSGSLPEDLLRKLSSSLTDTGSLETSGISVCSSVNEKVTSPTDIHLLEKGQRSLDSSLTKSVEWNDVVMVQHTGDDCKEERLSIERVMEVIQAKGQSGQRPASTYTVGSADTGYQGDGEFDLQSEIETASPCEEMKPLVSPSVSTSLSLDDMNASGGASSKMGKSGHLSDSDFFTEDPGETEEGATTPPVLREEPEQPSESADGSAACTTVADETLVEQPADETIKLDQETEATEPDLSEDTTAKQETEETTDTIKPDVSEESIPKKSKKLPHSGPVKKVVGVSKIKALLESQPSIDIPKKARTPKKNRWDAVTSKIQAGMAEEKVKPKKEVRGRVDTNLVAARVIPPPTTKKLDPLVIGARPVGNEGSVGPCSTRSTPVTECNILPADDETASQATTSARGTCSSVVSSSSHRPRGRQSSRSSSTASACRSTSSSSRSSVLSSIPSTSKHQAATPQSQSTARMPSKIAVRLQPRLETVAKVTEQIKKGARPVRTAVGKSQKAGPQTSKGSLHGTTVPLRSGCPPPPAPPAPATVKPRSTCGKPPQSVATNQKMVRKGASASPRTPQTPSTPLGGGNLPSSSVSGRPSPVIRSSLSSITASSPLVIPSSSRQQRQKLEELGREVQHLGALCESRTKELNRVKMQLRHAASGFDAFATLVQYLAGELNAFSHPDLVSEIQTTKEQLITLENFLRQCEGDLEGMREKHAEEVSVLTRQLQQAQEDTALLQEKLENAEKAHTKQCEEWELAKEHLQKEAASRQQAALEITQAQHASQIEALSAEHREEVKACEDRHQMEQEALKGQLDLMKERCRILQEQACSIEEALQKDTDAKIQWLSAKNADLQKEVESLKSVLEMKQDEVHNLRKENQIMSKQAEEVAVYRQRVSKLMSRIEELQALLREKSKNERKLSCDQRSLQEHLDKESKMNRQLSMEKEELLWRLSQSFNSSSGTLNASLLGTPDFVKKKRPAASTPFRLTPGSLPPFRENLQDDSSSEVQGDQNQVSSTSSLDCKPHRARVRVNRTRSCHTSPRNSPSHNSNSRMVASTPNMPCDDDNSVEDPSSSTKLSPCDSLTELHLKACMQLDCIDDLLLQQEQQQQQCQQQTLYSPNGASSPNSGSASMTSSAAEDLSLSSTEEEQRRHDNVTTSPRSQAGEAMTTVDETREAMITPDSLPGERVAPPSDNNLSDTPCFCDDFDISSEPE